MSLSLVLVGHLMASHFTRLPRLALALAFALAIGAPGRARATDAGASDGAAPDVGGPVEAGPEREPARATAAAAADHAVDAATDAGVPIRAAPSAPEPSAPEPSAPSLLEAPPTPAVAAPDRGVLYRLLGLPGEVTSRGEVAVESRAFRDDDDPVTVDRALALFGRLEWRHQHAPFEEKVRGYGRADHYDRRRSTVVLEEAWLQLRRGRLRLRLGADLINWTATEAFHPADVINARNLDSDLENLEKVGEPMVALQLGLVEGMTASLMFMPVRMKTLFPSPRSRLAFLPGVDLGQRRLMVDRHGHYTDGYFGPQAAFRVQQVVGGADISAFVLEQMDRLQPLVGLEVGRGMPIPVFLTVRQAGGTYQHVLGPVIAKVEAAYRWFRQPSEAPPLLIGPLPDRDHGTVAVGLEYGFLHPSGAESTFIVEGQVVLGVTEPVRRQLSPFQRDVFVGYRMALNDEDSKELVMGAILDLERPDEYLGTVAYQQRLGETFSLRLGLRIIAAPAEPIPLGLSPFRQADHLRLTLTRHF